MKRLSFNDMDFTRNSPAWCPITGNSVGLNSPRIVSDLILENAESPVIYHRFSEDQGFTAYDHDPGCYTRPGETTDYLVDLMDDFEELDESLERLSLGTSEEGRPLEAFRLGPVDRKHFMVTSVVHGNETDGLTGTFKGFELLITHPDFQTLRDNFTLFFAPCCNPDGHYNNTRMLAKTGPHPDGTSTKGINLNREWPNFWEEYSPSSSESKGATALSSNESQVLYDYRMTANASNPISVAFLLDQHSTVGDGFRYQSRDRTFKGVDQYDWFNVWGDWIIYRYLRAMQAKRIQEDGIPDLYVNYFRSRFNPHWHSWVSTNSDPSMNGGISPICMVSEHNKVNYVVAEADKETYQSACTYNMDYIIAAAKVMQGSVTTTRDAVLIEHEVGDNQVTNSEFDVWNRRTNDTEDAEYRPSYWNYKRSNVVQTSRSDKHMNYHGSSVEVSPDLILQVPATENLGPDNYHDVQERVSNSNDSMIVSNVIAGGGSVYIFDQSSLTGDLDLLFTDGSLPNNRQKRFAGANRTKVVLLDMGDLVSNNMKVISYLESGSYARTVQTTYTAPRVDAATAFNGVDTTYVIGGNSGSLEKTVLAVDRTAYGVSEIGTNLMTTADAKASAVYCSGGDLDGKIIVIGGQTTVVDQLRVVTVDPVAPSASEVLLDVSSSTLPDGLIGHALAYDGTDTIRIYGGQDPSTSEVFAGIWEITWTGAAWTIAEVTVNSGLGADADPEDYSGEGEWVDRWANWRYTRRFDIDEGTERIILVGGVKGDPETGVPQTGDTYRDFYVHDVFDGVIHLPQDSTYCYIRLNSAVSVSGYDKVSTSWSLKADTSTTDGYIRINNAPGDTVTGLYTTRYGRTYYMHPPKWWFRDQGVLDLSQGRPDRTEDEWRMYMRVYRDSQTVSVDSPMVQHGTLWPSSWSPKGLTRAVETATWEDAVDPRWLRMKITWLPFASFLCATSDFVLARITDGTRKIELWSLAGDRKERMYIRNMLHGPFDPKIQMRVYDSLGAYESCEIPVYWGGFFKETAQQRFDSPLTFEIWQHPEIGSGFLINNSGAIAKNSISGSFDRTTWGSEADIQLLGGGWWSEPDIYEIKKSWARTQNTPDTRGALLMGDRDSQVGKVNEEAPFRYTETFTRSDDPNLGSDWDIIKQTGAGFNIVSNKANCTDTGYERWDAEPNIRDLTITGDVSAPGNNCRVGFLTRLNYYLCNDDLMHGYLGSLYIDGSGNKYVQIEKLTGETGSQVRSTLVSETCTYTPGEEVTLSFDANDDSLTVTVTDSLDNVLGTCTTTDSTHDQAGSIGISGETPDALTPVTIDSVTASPSGSTLIRISE